MSSIVTVYPNFIVARIKKKYKGKKNRLPWSVIISQENKKNTKKTRFIGMVINQNRYKTEYFHCIDY